MHIHTINTLVDYVREAGEMAHGEQKRGRIKRRFKIDGSVITRIDEKLDSFLYKKISELFPEANILSEETTRPYDNNEPCSFAIDPLDGTDVFSQGMFGWCISVGLLKDMVPVAGIVYSPGLDLLLFSDVNKKATLNGDPIKPVDMNTALSEKSNIMVSSSIHKQIDLSMYPGKIRNIGSAALHLCFPLIYPGIQAALESRQAHIWDIAASHTIVLSHGFKFELFDGGDVRYQELLGGSTVGDVILCGTKGNIHNLRKVLTRM